jgi:hypothetical protein
MLSNPLLGQPGEPVGEVTLDGIDSVRTGSAEKCDRDDHDARRTKFFEEPQQSVSDRGSGGRSRSERRPEGAATHDRR